MTLPKTTTIISVYKETETLNFILENLTRRTIVPDQIIISKDRDFEEMKLFIDSKAYFCKNRIVKVP